LPKEHSAPVGVPRPPVGEVIWRVAYAFAAANPLWQSAKTGRNCCLQASIDLPIWSRGDLDLL